METEQKFSLSGTSARYVKFVGIGNSSSTNWTSIANVNIYGDVGCEGPTSIFDANSIIGTISVFPRPVTGGVLNIKSEDIP